MVLAMKITMPLALAGAAVLLLCSFSYFGAPSFVADGIADDQGNLALEIEPFAGTSANHLVARQGATTETATLTVDGTDANPTLALYAKGTGNVSIQGSDTENIAVFEDSQNAREYLTVTSGAIGDGITLRSDSAVSADVDLNLNTQGRGRLVVNGKEPLSRTWTKTVEAPVVGGLYTMAIADALLVPSGVNAYALGGGSITLELKRSFVKNTGAATTMGGAIPVPANGPSFAYTPPSGAAAVVSDAEIVWFEVTAIVGTVTEVCLQLDLILP